MQVLFIVLNHEEHFDELLKELRENDVRGGTILESQGMASTIAESQGTNYGYMRMMFNEGRPYNKTMFLVLEEDRVEMVKDCVRRAAGNINQENRGIMFTFSLDSWEGLTK